MGIIESIDRLLEDISSLEVDSSDENISPLDSSGDQNNSLNSLRGALTRFLIPQLRLVIADETRLVCRTP